MMTKIFLEGGLFTYPILLMLVAGMAVTIEHWIHLNRVRSVNRKRRGLLPPMLDKGAFDKPRTIISKDNSTVPQMRGTGLARQGVVRHREG